MENEPDATIDPNIRKKLTEYYDNMVTHPAAMYNLLAIHTVPNQLYKDNCEAYEKKHDEYIIELIRGAQYLQLDNRGGHITQLLRRILAGSYRLFTTFFDPTNQLNVDGTYNSSSQHESNQILVNRVATQEAIDLLYESWLDFPNFQALATSSSSWHNNRWKFLKEKKDFQVPSDSYNSKFESKYNYEDRTLTKIIGHCPSRELKRDLG